jgi:PPOX class probable FMN-dependent enzyme
MSDGAPARFRSVVSDPEDLRALVGVPSELAVRKETAHLTAAAREFIARSPFALLATAGASGRCDVSPRGDMPGFALVLDDHTVVIPDRPGNRRTDSLRNLLENPQVGLLFVVPGTEETLRVNGRGWIVRDDEILDQAVAMGKRPLLAIAIDVQECFFHCAKAFKRAHLWEPDRWPDCSDVIEGLIAERAKAMGTTVEAVQQQIQESYRTRMY